MWGSRHRLSRYGEAERGAVVPLALGNIRGKPTSIYNLLRMKKPSPADTHSCRYPFWLQ